MKKRNCRKTPEERDQHAEATSLRKMTDAQLVEAFRGVGGKHECSASDFLEYLDSVSNTGNGIGKLTVMRLKKIYRGSNLCQ